KTAEHVRNNHNLESYVEELYLENKKINTLIDNISDAILAVGPEHKFLFANHHFRKYFIPANVSASDLATYRLWDLAPQLGEIKALFEQALRDKTKTEKNNMHFSFNGQKFIVDTTITPLKDADDRISGALGVFHDVTQHRLNEQFREAFVSNVSHEVRTPLTALKGYVQILKDTSYAQAELVKNSLLKIESNAARLIALFNDVLSLSMIESRQSIAKEEFSAPEFFASILPNLQQVYPHKEITVTEEINCPTLYGNPALLEQVVTNLLDNAYKYSPAKTTISITAQELKDQGVAEIKIADQGMGIAAEHLPRLFERFYRANASRSREIPGTGLGLAIVKHIIQKHDGKISVTSTLGQGTCFTIHLPLAPAHPLPGPEESLP
ncbi:MAG: PAS domain-containing protein, partial [Bacteriovoracaceae bacterium]|nr:PAS domain-containing protein [Bacteriovoracaceae bacterium]